MKKHYKFAIFLSGQRVKTYNYIIFKEIRKYFQVKSIDDTVITFHILMKLSINSIFIQHCTRIFHGNYTLTPQVTGILLCLIGKIKALLKNKQCKNILKFTEYFHKKL